MPKGAACFLETIHMNQNLQGTAFSTSSNTDKIAVVFLWETQQYFSSRTVQAFRLKTVYTINHSQIRGTLASAMNRHINCLHDSQVAFQLQFWNKI